ncbi:MAG TPA: hypothetical protein VF070_44970 [Streptosporangiaceae bacterium]
MHPFVLQQLAAECVKNQLGAADALAPLTDYVRRLNALPGDWPAPEETERD